MAKAMDRGEGFRECFGEPTCSVPQPLAPVAPS